MRGAAAWWERRGTALLLILAMAVPLVWPPVPPLVDLPGHMGRYAVQISAPDSPLRNWYRFEWHVIGNLGVDLLIELLGPLLGIEAATKLIVMCIPVMSAAGLLWIAKEVHGRVTPTAYFALPLMLGHPFLFGFVNFSLSMALALLSFALWLRLGRRGMLRFRALLFVLIAPIVWVCHTYGWGMLGLLCFSAEVIRQRDLGLSWLRALVGAGLHCLVLAPPLVLMIIWRAETVDPSAATLDWFNWRAKLRWIVMTFRDRWYPVDGLCLGILIIVLVYATISRRLTFSRNLLASAVVLLGVYLLLPRVIFGSAYADMRLTPYLFAIAVLAIRPTARAETKFLAAIALAAIGFTAARLTATTASLAIESNRYSRALVALDHLPRAARLAWFTQGQCGNWSMRRMVHLGALAMVRRQAFSNDQWYVAGAQLMKVTRHDAPRFSTDNSQIVTATACRANHDKTLNWSLANLPRRSFDYIWLLEPPTYDRRLTADLTPVWRDGNNVLFRINR